MTKAATCTTCGNTYTETIFATGNHDWVYVYKTVEVPVYETKYICKYEGYGYYCDTAAEITDHISVIHGGAASTRLAVSR